MSERIWQSRSGPVSIADMGDRHLAAAIRWAENNASRVRMHRALQLDMAADSMGGEMAQASLQDAADALWEGDDANVEDWWDEYRWLLDEATQRGLLE